MPLEVPDRPQLLPSTSGNSSGNAPPKKKAPSAVPSVQEPEDDTTQMSAHQRFYYLRLMAKPGQRPEPIKMKFVRWAPPLERKLSVDDEGTLESQAMRVVRTIGQAFEVCHKMAQDQMQEKQLEETEANNNNIIRARVSGSAISEEDLQQLQAIAAEELRATTERLSKTPSPVAPPPPPPPAPSSGKRHSIFIPRRFSSDVSSLGTEPASTSATNPVVGTTYQPVEQQPSTSQGLAQGMPIGGNPHGAAGFPPNMFPSGSNTLPHSYTWNPGHPTAQAGNFPSLQSLESAQTAHTTYPFYPFNPIIAPSASMPYGLSSQAAMVSPYATLQLATHSQSQTGTHEQQQPSTSSVPNPVESAANLSAALQFSRSLDQYNQSLIRAQLDQAQQAAQVANCQVQLLRDQLTSETTARIEAQSRTHQLLNTNRELLEQVQNLVTRLQHLETKLSTDIHTAQPGQMKARPPPPLEPSFTTTASVPNMPITTAAAPFLPSTSTQAVSYDETLSDKLNRKFSEGQSLKTKPYQIQTLADLRSGSLPPSSEEDPNAAKKRRRPIDDSGTRTEPETEDTDYSSSDQYEKTGLNKLQNISDERDDQLPHYSVLLSNPQNLGDLSSFFQPYNMPGQPRLATFSKAIPSATPMERGGVARPIPMQPLLMQQQIPHHTFVPIPNQQSPPQTVQQLQMSPQQQEEEKQELPPLPAELPKKRKSGLNMGVLKEKEFTRMSFNSRLNPRSDKRGSLASANAPSTSTTTEMIETIPEEPRLERRRSSIATVVEQKDSTITRPMILPAKFDLPSTSKVANPPVQLVTSKQLPASASVATAMYPPVKTGFAAPLNKILPESKKFRALSVDLDKSPLKNVALQPLSLSPPTTNDPMTSNQPSGKPPTIPMLSAAIERLSNRSGATATNNNNNLMNANPATPPLRYMPKGDGNVDVANILNNNRPEAIRGFIDPDSIRGRTLQALDSQKLSDPQVLARLTRNINIGKDGNVQLPNGLP